MPTRILYTIPNFITAGSGAALLNIARRLDRSMFEPTICVRKRGGRLEAEIERFGIPLLEAEFTVPALPYASLPLRAWQVARTLRPYRFDLWHSFNYSDDYTEPLIARLAGARHWVFTKKNMGWGHRAWYVRTLLASRVAALNSDMIRGYFKSPVFRRKARLLPRGVDAEKFRPDVPARLALRKKYGIENRFVVGIVAHMVPVKGIETLIDAAALLPDVVVLLAGKELDTDYVASLRARVEQHGLRDRVFFVGDTSDVPAFLSELDAFCLTTLATGRQEALGVALLEAMACGLACVSTDMSGPHDIVRHGIDGLLIPPAQPEALAAAIKQCMDPAVRARLGAGARDRVMQSYTIEREVADHVALYQELVGR